MISFYKIFLYKGVTVVIFLFPFFSALANTTDSSKPAVEPVSVSNILQIFLWLAIVVSVIVFLTWMIKKVSGINANLSGTIKVVSGVHVGQREKIALVQVGEKQILVGITSTAITKLHELEKNVELPDTNSTSTGTFAEKLKLAISKGKQDK